MQITIEKLNLSDTRIVVVNAYGKITTFTLDELANICADQGVGEERGSRLELAFWAVSAILYLLDEKGLADAETYSDDEDDELPNNESDDDRWDPNAVLRENPYNPHASDVPF